MIGSALAFCIVAAVPDGDTIRCADGTRLRLAGIDAPEFHCRRGRRCAPGDPIASRESLRALAGPAVRYRVVDANRCRAGFQSTDPYGRPVALVYAPSGELGAEQLRRGFAVRWTCRR